MPALHQHVGRHHDAAVAGSHHRGVVAGSEQDHTGLNAAAHQATITANSPSLLQVGDPGCFVAQATSWRSAAASRDRVNLPARAGGRDSV